jgi:hypothetical protein
MELTGPLPTSMGSFMRCGLVVRKAQTAALYCYPPSRNRPVIEQSILRGIRPTAAITVMVAKSREEANGQKKTIVTRQFRRGAAP